MQIETLTRIDQIQEGDILLISDGKEITPAKAQRVKVSEHDGTEVIFDLRRNKFFNVGMYLTGSSWAKDIRVVRVSAG
jgi:ribosomal protein L14E/L6E/L27E